MTPHEQLSTSSGWAITREDVAWFAAVSVTALLGGAWMLYIAEIYVVDALARAANAHHVMFSRDPHLAAIGFIWPPLPSVLEAPFVALLRPFGQAWFAPQIVSAGFTGLLATTLNRWFALFEIPPGWRVALVLVLVLNPLVAYSAINGMTENLFLFFILAAGYALIRWREGQAGLMAVAGVMTGLAFFVRYEAVAFAAAGVIAIFALSGSRLRRDGIRTTFLEAQLIAYLAPIAFAIFLWVLWNQLFLGDALFFLRGVGSNEFYTGALRDSGVNAEMALAFDSLPRTALFTLRRLISVFPVFLPAVGGVALAWLLTRRNELLALLALALALPAFAALQVFRGQLFDWVRFWIAIVPFSAILATALIRHGPGAWRGSMLAAFTATLALSGIATGLTMAGTVRSEDERDFVTALRRPTEQVSESLDGLRQIAGRLDALPGPDGEEALIAIDAYVHAPLVLITERPQALAVVSDRDFLRLLRPPFEQLDYVLIPEPLGIAAATDLNRSLPGVYERGAPGFTLIEEFDAPAIGKARLYQVEDIRE